MTVIVDFTVPAAAFELGQALQFPEVQIQLFQLVPRGDRFVPYIWVHLENDQLTEYDDSLATDDRIQNATIVEDNENERLYRIDWATELNGLFDGFRNHELSVESAKGTADRWEFRVFNRQHDNLEAFQSYCEDEDIPITVERVFHPTPHSKPPDWGLTPEQQDALVTAYEAGYFEVPQSTSLDDLGDELDISRQAVSNRLHRGIETLIGHTLLVDDSEMES